MIVPIIKNVSFLKRAVKLKMLSFWSSITISYLPIWSNGLTKITIRDSHLPAYKRIILDEAHHIEDIATEYFADRFNRLELNRVLARLAADKMGGALGKLLVLKEKLQLAFQKTPPLERFPAPQSVDA